MEEETGKEKQKNKISSTCLIVDGTKTLDQADLWQSAEKREVLI